MINSKDTKPSKTDKLISSYSDFVIQRRWWVFFLALFVGLFAASGGRFMGMNNDYRVFFSDENPQLKAFEQIQQTYTKVDNILFAVVPKDGDAFSAEYLEAIEEITLQSWQLPYSLRVDSVTNFQHTSAEADDLVVQDLVEGASQLSASDLRERKLVALNEPFLIELLVNVDASVTGVNVTFHLPEKSIDEAPTAVSAARALAADIENRYEVKVHLTGMVMLTNAFFESSMNDMSTLVPLMYLIIIFIAWVLLRSVTATIGTVVVMMLSVMSGLGLAGYSGILLTPPSSAAMTIIMTLAVADSVHILVTMLNGMRAGLNKREAIRESLRLNVNPVVLTSVTTSIGFLSMNFSDSPPFHDLGNITAMGVMAALFFSLTLLPALMAILPVKVKQRQGSLTSAMSVWSRFVIRRQNTILIAGIVVSGVLLSFISKNELDDNFVSYFDETMSFRQDTDLVNERLSGVYQVQYSLETGSDNGVSDPVFLANLDKFVRWLKEQPEVRHVNTISDTFKRLNKNLNGDDEAFYRLPEQQDLAAQYLLLYELSLPYGLDLNNQLNINKSSTQITVTLSDLPSKKLRDFSERGSAWIEQNLGQQSYGVGPAIMFAYVVDRNIKGMLVGTFVALILISLLIILALRNVKLGMISFIPNLLPAGLALGFWGMTVGEINMAVSMVTGMALGIVVDDTIHFLSKYLRARREQQLNTEQAIQYAFVQAGVPILVTSLILVAGFLVLAQSAFGMNSNMASLTAIAIFMAVLADFLLLPALLLKLDAKKTDITNEIPQSKKLEDANYV